MYRNIRNDHNASTPRRVCFRPRDDVFQPSPPDLVSNDEEFIRVGKMVLKKTKMLRRESCDTSWFRRVLYQDLSSLQNHENDPFLDHETLKEFKKAVLVRLDDDDESDNVRDHGSVRAPKMNTFSQVPSLITAVLQSVNEVGWPKPDGAGPSIQNVSIFCLIYCFFFFPFFL